MCCSLLPPCVLRSSDSVSLELREDGEKIVKLSMRERREDDFENV